MDMGFCLEASNVDATSRDRRGTEGYISGRGNEDIMTYVVQRSRVQGVFLDLHVKPAVSWQVDRKVG